jgi:putative transposase
MKKGQYTEEQIIGILREVEAGQKVADVCRRYGVSESTFHATARYRTFCNPTFGTR